MVVTIPVLYPTAEAALSGVWIGIVVVVRNAAILRILYVIVRFTARPIKALQYLVMFLPVCEVPTATSLSC